MKIGGHEINNWWLIGGGVAVVGGYLFWKHEANSSAASSSSSSDSSAIDPVTGLPYSEDNTVDPATGLTYLAEAQEYGSVQAAEEMVTSGSAYYGDTGTGDIDTGNPYPSTSTSTGSTATTYTTNAQWASAVQAGLVGVGYSSESIGTALGQYFAQMPENATSAGIMQVALAEFGPPPQGTYSIIPEPGGGGTGQTVGGYQAYAPGGKRLDQLTVPGVTYDDLAKANPEVAKKYDGKDLPKGTGYFVPKETAPSKSS